MQFFTSHKFYFLFPYRQKSQKIAANKYQEF
jgi:hypothetical protein